jgi:coatomer protein complex subunit alpha (xenin)
LEAAGMTEEDVPPLASSSRSQLSSLPIITPTSSSNWPVKPIGDDFFAKALVNGHDAPRANGDVADEGAAELSSWGNDNPLNRMDDGAGDEDGDAEEEDGGWDLDAEVPEEETVEEQAHVEESTPEDSMTPGISESEIWVRNSPLAADHIAAGSFDSAMTVRSSLLSPILFWTK